PDRGVGAVAGEAVEGLGRGIETDDGVGAEIGQPDLVVLVDPHRVRARMFAGQLPRLPALARLVHAHLARVPLADPDPAFRIAPHAPRTLVFRGRIDRGGGAGLRVDARDVAAGQRGVVHLARWCGGDAVRPPAARRLPHFHLAALRVDTPVVTGLS